MFMFKYNAGSLPDVFNELFTKNRDVNTYETRQKYKLHIPKSQTVHSQKSVKYICISSWNYIVDKLNIIGGAVTF